MVLLLMQLDRTEVNDMESLDTIPDLQESFNCSSKFAMLHMRMYIYLSRLPQAITAAVS